MTLDPSVEAVLAWAVREGATNVIRHSGARHCTLKISASLADATVEVVDDGPRGGVPSHAGVPSYAGVATSEGVASGAASGAGVPRPRAGAVAEPSGPSEGTGLRDWPSARNC